MILLLSVLLPLPASSLASGPASADDTLRFVVMVGDAEVGSLEEVRANDAHGRVLTTERTDLSLQRGSDAIRIRQEAVWVEEEDGSLVGVELLREGVGPTPWRDAIRRVASGWIRSRSRGGEAIEDTLPGTDLLGPRGIDALIRTLGSHAIVRTVDGEDLTPVTIGIARVGADTLDTLDGPVPCRVFTLKDSSRAGSESRQWRGSDGRIWREVEPSLGWSLERRGVRNREEARASLDALTWKSLEVLGAHDGSDPCAFILEGNGADLPPPAQAPPPIPDTLGVELVPGPAPGSWVVRLRPSPPGATTQGDRNRWRDDPALLPYLQDGLMIDASAPVIHAFSGAATRGAANPTEEALLLERAVHDRIAIRDLGTVFATASQTLRAGRGDCTEHAVLLAACCRARGIPARLVAGFVPLGGRTAFHLWTEVYLNEWIPMDATRGEGRPDPCAVPLVRWIQPEDGMRDLEDPIRRLASGYRVVFPKEGR